jgi:hypothetical protein
MDTPGVGPHRVLNTAVSNNQKAKQVWHLKKEAANPVGFILCFGWKRQLRVPMLGLWR